MLFEDSEEKLNMAPQKEIIVALRCDQEFRDFLGRESIGLNMTISDILRVSVLLALPQIKSIRGIARIQLEDIRDETKTQ